MASMIRGMSVREAMLRPAMSYSRRLPPRKRALCTSTTKTTPPVVSPPPRSPSTDTAEAATEGAHPTGGRPSSRKRMEWRPSEVHRASATSLRRKEAEKTRPKSAGVPARVASAGGMDTRSPGLRRRELLGGVEDATPQTELASAPAIPAPVRPTLQTEPTTGGERSVVSSSATETFRRRRELDRLAAAGNVEAQEAIRTLGSTSNFYPPDSATSPGDKGANEGGDGDPSDRGSGGGLTPLTVLPLLLALIAAGYCAANDLLPLKWLPSSGGGGGASEGSPGQDSTVARSEGNHEYPSDGGEDVGTKGSMVERERRSLGDSLRWQRRQPSSAASPLSKKNISRASPSSSSAPDDAAATATAFTDTPTDGWRNGKARLGAKATDQDTKTTHQGTPERANTSGPDGNRESGKGGRWGWWGPEGAPPAGGGEGGVISRKSPSAAIMLVGAGEGERGGGGAGDGKGLPQRDAAGVQKPLWLQRWRAPASSRPS